MLLKLHFDREYLFATLFFAFNLLIPTHCLALLGETEAECEARYGAPARGEASNTLVFKRNNRELEIQFNNGRAVFITCRDAPVLVEKVHEIPVFRSEMPIYAVASHSAQDSWTFANAPLKVLSFLWGAPEPSALYLGMWSTHLTDPDLDVANNWLIGLNFRGYFLGTFMNSYDKRSWATGVERRIFSLGKQNQLNASLGYRLGLMTGYEDRFTPFFGNSPIIVFPQLYSNIAYDHIGVQLSYSWSVVTAGFYIRF
jgi:hypothetical protein